MGYVVLEWIQLICLTFCIGVIACRLWFLAPSMHREYSYRENFVPGLWRLFCYALAVLLLCALAGLVARSMEISGEPVSRISSVLPLVLFKTHYGTVWFVRVGALVLLAAAKTAVRYRDKRSFLVAMLVLASAVTLTASASGHAADAGDFSVPEIMDWLHLVAACLWGGGLMVLSFSVLPDLIGRDLGPAPLISRTARRFSAMAGVAVVLIVITAIYNFRFDVGSLRLLPATPYGIAVAAKILLLLVLITLGGFNRYVSVPLLQEWAGEAPEFTIAPDRIAGRFFAPFRRKQTGPLNALRFRRLVWFEAALMVAVLLCAAVLRHEVPARHAAMMQHHMGQPTEHNIDMNMDQHDAMHMESVNPGEVVVNLDTKPEKLRAGTPAEITFSIRDNKGNPMQDLTVMHERLLHVIIVSADFSTFAHIHPDDFGPITSEMKKKAEYTVRYTFPLAGRYLIAMDSAVKGAFVSEHFTVDVSGNPKMGTVKEDFSKGKRFGEYEARFSSTPERIVAGQETVLKFVIRKKGGPVADLEPYLAAPMHLAVIKADLRNFIHAHGELPGEQDHEHPMGHIHGVLKEKFGPEIEARVVFPVQGVYQIFGQVKHRGKIILLSFMVKVY